MKKFIPLAVVAMLAAGSANADSIYIDVGNDYDTSAADNDASVNDNSTGWFESLQFTYESETEFTDANNDGVLSGGDTFVANAGMALGTTFADLNGSKGTNLNGGFFPGKNGFNVTTAGNGWAITFGISNLTGQVNGNGTLGYNTGTISMYFFEFNNGVEPAATDISTRLVHLFDMDIVSGFTDGDSTNFNGDITNFGALNVNGVAAGDVFNIAYAGGATTFANATSLPGGLFFDISNDTQGTLFTNYAGGDGSSQTVDGQHEGSVSYSVVPEPTTLAILGLGLLGFAGTRRSKS